MMDTLRKPKGPKEHVGVCELWIHEFGWELGWMDGVLRRSQLCREHREWARHRRRVENAPLKASWRSDDAQAWGRRDTAFP